MTSFLPKQKMMIHSSLGLCSMMKRHFMLMEKLIAIMYVYGVLRIPMKLLSMSKILLMLVFFVQFQRLFLALFFKKLWSLVETCFKISLCLSLNKVELQDDASPHWNLSICLYFEHRVSRTMDRCSQGARYIALHNWSP